MAYTHEELLKTLEDLIPAHSKNHFGHDFWEYYSPKGWQTTLYLRKDAIHCVFGVWGEGDHGMIAGSCTVPIEKIDRVHHFDPQLAEHRFLEFQDAAGHELCSIRVRKPAVAK